MGRGKEAAEILSYRKRECRRAEYDYKPYDTASAGASGALFGLVGVLFVFGIKYQHKLPEGLKREFGTGLLLTLAVNLFDAVGRVT